MANVGRTKAGKPRGHSPPPQPGVARAGALLTHLLLATPRYRDEWREYVRRRPRPGTVPSAAIARVVTAQYLDIINPGRTDPRSIRDTIAAALAGRRCTPETMRWLQAAFRMDAADKRALDAALWADDEAPQFTAVPLSQVPTSRHRTISLDELHVIGPDRRPVRHRTHQRIEALAGGLHSYTYLFDTPEADVVVEDGGYPGEVTPFGDGLWGVQIQLARELAQGQQLVLVYDTRFHYSGEVEPVFRRATRQRDVESVTVRVRFDPSCIPDEVVRTTWDSVWEITSEVAAELDDQATALAIADPLPAGTALGFRWRWSASPLICGR